MALDKKYILEGVSDYEYHKEDMDVWAQECNDGYHTFNELYEHRHALFCALTKLYDNYLTPIGSRVKCFKSKHHHPNNDAMMDGWFIVWIEVNKLIGPMDIISYHLPISWWDRFKLMEMKFGPLYNGYSSEDVLKRIMAL